MDSPSQQETQNFTDSSETVLKKFADEGDHGNLVQTAGIIAGILNEVNATKDTTKNDDVQKSAEVYILVSYYFFFTRRRKFLTTVNSLMLLNSFIKKNFIIRSLLCNSTLKSKNIDS